MFKFVLVAYEPGEGWTLVRYVECKYKVEVTPLPPELAAWKT